MSRSTSTTLVTSTMKSNSHDSLSLKSTTESTASGRHFRFLTLNCFGLMTSIRRRKRFESIVSFIQERRVHIVCLQELFVSDDYKFVSKSLENILPFSHWLTNTSLVGSSGLAILSRWPLKVIHFTPFILRGNPVKLYHGDFFVTKGIAYAKIMIPCGSGFEPVDVHVFNSHTHAKYVEQEDTRTQYAIYRLTQTYQLANNIQMICEARQTRNRSLVILGGDLNMFQNELSYRLILLKAGMFDCHPCNKFFKCDGLACRTYEHPCNTIVGKESSSALKEKLERLQESDECDQANKLDYVFVKLMNSHTVCNICVFAETGLDPSGQSLSDHQPVLVNIKVAAREARTRSIQQFERSKVIKDEDDVTKRLALRSVLEEVEKRMVDYNESRRCNSTCKIITVNILLFVCLSLVVFMTKKSIWFDLFIAIILFVIVAIFSLIVLMTNDTDLKGINTTICHIQHDIQNTYIPNS